MATKKPKSVIKNVVRVTRSPMNERIWYLDLECGHDTTVVSKSRPTRQTFRCPDCTYPEMSSGQ